MVHEPCGVLNRSCVCMEDVYQRWSKAVLWRNYSSSWWIPFLQMKRQWEYSFIGQQEVDNRWIVQYNPYLSEKFGAHINVEACTTIKSVKYPFKYVYKGYDCAIVEVKETSELNHDEISTFLDARYVSAPGGYWRLSEFKMHDHSHAIIRLPVHLPRQQPVYFQRGKHEVAVNNTADADTMLTAFFKHNNLSQTGLRYSEFPLHFVFNKSLKKWQARKKKCNIIARMYSVSPKDIERYSLRFGCYCYTYLVQCALMIYALWITTRLIIPWSMLTSQLTHGWHCMGSSSGRGFYIPNACPTHISLCHQMSSLWTSKCLPSLG